MSWSAGSGNSSAPSDPLPAELLHVLMLPDFERTDRIGLFSELPGKSRLRRAT